VANILAMHGRPLLVAVYSPQQVIHEGLVSVLGKQPARVEVVALPRTIDHIEPDVVLYDVLALIEGDTDSLTFLVEKTTAKILAVGRDLRPDLVATALAAGADGFFSIGADEDEILEAVESAGTGWREGDDGPNPIIGSAGSEGRAQQLGTDVGLTDREAEVLARIAEGYSNQEIAGQLFLSINSVKTYIRSAYRKIDASSRSQAVSWAIRHGFCAEPRRVFAVEQSAVARLLESG
jgi:DNA-binding NarL/FixJ family response regulator